MSSSEGRRERIEEAWAAAWDRGDVDALDALHTHSYQRHSTDGDTRDLTDFKASIISTRSAFPDLVTTIDEIVIEGDRVAIRWHSTGTHEHSFLGVPATKRSVSVSGATFGRFEGDKIIEETVTWDPRSLLTALGVLSIGQAR